MKKTVMYTETRTWFFDLDLAQDADLKETMRALKNTSGSIPTWMIAHRMNTKALGMRCPRIGDGRAIPTIPRTSEL